MVGVPPPARDVSLVPIENWPPLSNLRGQRGWPEGYQKSPVSFHMCFTKGSFVAVQGTWAPQLAQCFKAKITLIVSPAALQESK